jgi:large subunit ribosomal protein L29
MKAKELRSKDMASLTKELESLTRDHFNMRFKKATGQLSRTHELNAVKKNIARVKTIMSEKTKGSNV